MHWLLTIKYSCFISMCPFVRTLYDVEGSCAANNTEPERISPFKLKSIPFKSKSWSTVRKPNFPQSTALSIITISHEDLCGLSHAHSSCDSAPKFNVAGNWFYLCQNVCIHTSPFITIICRNGKYVSDLEGKRSPIQRPSFCCSTSKTS